MPDSTIDSYNPQADNGYPEKTTPISNEIKEWLDLSVASLPRNGKILEIGTGTGRDADYIERTLGLRVLRSDDSEYFLELQSKNGRDPNSLTKLNIAESPFTKKVDLIIADAVFLYFNDEELDSALQNVIKSLRKNGIFAFTVKIGEGEEIVKNNLNTRRYVKYWNRRDLIAKLNEAGFESLVVSTTKDGKWLHVICRPRQRENENEG